MKYLITESQIDNIVSMYLDNQDFVHIGYGENIFLGYKKFPKIPFLKYRKKLIHFNIRIWDKQFQIFLKKELK